MSKKSTVIYVTCKDHLDIKTPKGKFIEIITTELTFEFFKFLQDWTDSKGMTKNEYQKIARHVRVNGYYEDNNYKVEKKELK